MEARHYGVPIIGLPVYGDQPKNADIIVEEGWGIKMDITELTQKSLTDSINDILTNPKYRTCFIFKQSLLNFVFL